LEDAYDTSGVEKSSLDLPEEGEGSDDVAAEKPKEKGGVMDWVKENPIMTGAIVLGVGFAGYFGYKAFTKKPPQRRATKPVQGLNAPRQKRRSASPKREKGVVNVNFS